ncbi:CPBP family intramembrane metalloprotease [Oscillatoriales cyanobacterium LEGE 11467]|uniref:CPBP family intramembrane metalloprotease n=1 Tax=Zarconia navalis LEGE 11467 TaxID=1828826 RepID=A0A928Z907_9CYAN|nr:CPBP family intramembrane metalloprotease [Zarconia navalis LEGE 11467]
MQSLATRSLATRLTLFLVSLLLLWLPFAIPIYALIDDPNWQGILTLTILYGEFIWLVRWWGREVYRNPHILHRYGLRRSKRNGRELLFGLGLGLTSLCLLLVLEGQLGWLQWQSPPAAFLRIAIEGLPIALGVGFAEELLFRGWLLDELQRDYRKAIAIWINAGVFALLHFIKPIEVILSSLPAFPGLVLLGLTLIWAKQASGGRLGLSIGLHAGLVWGYYLTHVGGLVEYADVVPMWVTGLDRNPLAGVMGMLCLGGIAIGIRRKMRSKVR